MASSQARDFFESVRSASVDAERIRRQLLDAEERALAITRPTFEARTRGTHGDRMASNVGFMVDLEEQLRERQKRDYDLIDLAYAVLYGCEWTDGLAAIAPPVWADVLAHRYCNGETWAQVARAVGYSERQAYNIAQAALDLLDANGMQDTIAGRGMAEDTGRDRLRDAQERAGTPSAATSTPRGPARRLEPCQPPTPRGKAPCWGLGTP